MAKRRIHLEHLLGRNVRDSKGRSAGRLEEVIAHNRAGRCVVEKYLLGSAGLAERLSIAGVSLLFLRFLGAHKTGGSQEVPWDQLDLSDPKHPRLKCTIEQLKSMQKQ